jgi:hypothetical protein
MYGLDLYSTAAWLFAPDLLWSALVIYGLLVLGLSTARRNLRRFR